MIVQCPRCSARYRVEEEVLKDDPTFKCSRCSHIFAYEGGKPSEPPAPVIAEAASGGAGTSLAATAPAPPGRSEPPPPAVPRSERREPAKTPREDSLSFSFGGDAKSSSALGGRAIPGLTVGEEEIGSDPDRDEAFALGDEEDEFGDEPRAESEPRIDEPRFVRGEDELRREEEGPGGPVRPYVIFLFVLAALYANAAVYLQMHPDETVAMLADIPMIGKALTEDRLLQTRILLQDIEGVYQQIKDDKTVFVVSGRAVNTSDKPLKGVQIESGLYDATGTALEVKSIFCGNAMSLKIVKDLSMKEISLLQRLEPPQRFEIRPGEAAAFTVVFVSPPVGMTEYTARVVSAQRAVS